MFVKEPTHGYLKNSGFDALKFHRHSHHEIYYLLKGRRRYIIENKICDLSEGDIVIVPSMALHKTVNIPDFSDKSTHERYLITVDVGHVPPELEAFFTARFYHLNGDDILYLKNIIHEFIQGDLIKDANSVILKKANLIRLIVFLTRCNTEQDTARTLSKQDRIIESAACYIKENCHEPLTLASVAEHFFFSREYFSTLFKKTTGIGFLEYLTSMRLSRALSLLTGTSLPISKISESCGFNDSNYFSSVFTKNLGVSPLEYRKQHK